MYPKNKETGLLLNISATKYQTFKPFFLLKTEIHTQILNTKPFLCDFWGLRYLQNKMRFFFRWFWSKHKLFDLELLHILKMIMIKTIITSIQSVLVTRSPRNHLGAIRARLGPVGGAWHKFCGFEATGHPVWYYVTLSRSEWYITLYKSILYSILQVRTELCFIKYSIISYITGQNNIIFYTV